MYNCGFEYGFDNNLDASDIATSTVVGNWGNWQNELLNSLCKKFTGVY